MIKLKINTPMRGYKKGQQVKLESSHHNPNLPADRFWRKRIADSAIDNCVEIVQDKKVKGSAQPNKKDVKDDLTT